MFLCQGSELSISCCREVNSYVSGMCSYVRECVLMSGEYVLMSGEGAEHQLL